MGKNSHRLNCGIPYPCTEVAEGDRELNRSEMRVSVAIINGLEPDELEGFILISLGICKTCGTPHHRINTADNLTKEEMLRMLSATMVNIVTGECEH